MRLMLALIAAVLLSVEAAYAQTEFSGGAKGGVAFSSVSSDDEIFQDILTDSRTGVVIGGFVMMPLTDTFAIQPEVLWVQKGASGSEEGANLTLQLDYLEIPILANFRFSPENRIRPFVFTGPVPAFNTAAKVTNDQGVADEQLDEDVKSFDFGWTFGGGVQYENLTFEGRYTIGLGGINEDSLGTVDDPKNGSFAILVGIILG
jgi:opacity protein-like surface antigen